MCKFYGSNVNGPEGPSGRMLLYYLIVRAYINNNNDNDNDDILSLGQHQMHPEVCVNVIFLLCCNIQSIVATIVLVKVINRSCFWEFY